MKLLPFAVFAAFFVFLSSPGTSCAAGIKVEGRVERLPEGKVTYHLDAWKGKTRVWHREWKDLHETELNIASPVQVHKDRVYVVVRVELYSLDLATGEEIFGDVEVGSCSHAPVIARDGTIYCTGYYGPFLTAVSQAGQKLWSYDNEEMWWPMKLKLSGRKIRVSYGGEGNVAIFDTSGRLLEKKERN